jgi:hypothetical protein
MLLDIVNYFAHGMGVGFSLYQSGFYNIAPRGLMPYLNAKYDVEFPGMM